MAWRNARRNLVRTLLTGSTIAMGTAMLAIAIAWLQGVFGDTLAAASEPAGHVRIATPAYVQREALLPLASAIQDVQPVLDAFAGTDLHAFPRILTTVTLSPDGTLGDVLGAAVGAPLSWYRERLQLPASTHEGRMLAAPDEFVLGAGLAQRLNASLGEELILLGRTQDGAMSPLRGTIVGIAATGNNMVDQSVFMTLDRAQWMADLPDGATEVLVYGSSRDDALAHRDRVLALLPEGLAAQAWSEREPWNALIALIAFVQSLLEGIILFVAALGVGNTTMMSVVERRAELGVLRAMGMTDLEVVLLVVAEALGIGIIASVIGVGIGSMGALYLEQHGLAFDADLMQNLPLSVATRLHADFDAEVAITAFVLGVAMAGLGAAVPAVRATRIDPIEALRDGI